MAMRKGSPQRSSQRATNARESTVSDTSVIRNMVQKLKTVFGIVKRLVSNVPNLRRCY